MIRKLVCLTKDLVSYVKGLANKKGISFSEMLRRILDEHKTNNS